MWVLFLEVAVEVAKSKSHSSRCHSPMKEALHAPYVHTVNSVCAMGPAHYHVAGPELNEGRQAQG